MGAIDTFTHLLNGEAGASRSDSQRQKLPFAKIFDCDLCRLASIACGACDPMNV